MSDVIWVALITAIASITTKLIEGWNARTDRKLASETVNALRDEAEEAASHCCRSSPPGSDHPPPATTTWDDEPGAGG